MFKFSENLNLKSILPEWLSSGHSQQSHGPLELLVVQPTPFCNLDCSYCYLADRSNPDRMSFDTLRKTLERTIESGLVSDRFTLVWHAGEPLTVGVGYFKEAVKIVSEVVGDSATVRHSIQTNGVLIDDDWCDFFIERKVNIGVSIDGPAAIHDRYRKTRNGKGTHARTLRGIEKLKSRDIKFHTISVLTDVALSAPVEMFDFFLELAPDRCCFNIEEQEGINQLTSLSKYDGKSQVKAFFMKLMALNAANGFPLSVRELDGALGVIQGWKPDQESELSNHCQEINPFRIITVDINGNFSTFSPELIDALDESNQNFTIGNIQDTGFREAAAGYRFRKIYHL